MKTTKQILQEARDLFASTHWIKGQYKVVGPKKTQYCLIGGLRHTSGYDDIHCTWQANEYHEAIELIVHNLPDDYRRSWPTDSVIIFNDKPDTQLDDVLLVLDKAIAQAA